MDNTHLFADRGTHTLVDGQFGSTGKGLLADYLAGQAIDQGRKFTGVLSNAGPNSGHTFYDQSGNKHVLKQLPTFAVSSYLRGVAIPVYLTAGAIIDPEILYEEANRYPGIPIYVHPNAAVVWAEDKIAEHSGSVAAVAGTRSGAGVALSRKVLREPDAVWGNYEDFDRPVNIRSGWHHFPSDLAYFVEVSQGFSLGLNQQFYPKCTSRECTVSQALADAGLPPNAHSISYMAMRTFPIRVGNVDGYSSGDFYPDQSETTWGSIGVEPELTTVTKRVRRVFTFSALQYEAALRANCPDFVFINFLNYLKEEDRDPFLTLVKQRAPHVGYLGGYGPHSRDVRFL